MVEKINKLPKCSENVTNFAYEFYGGTNVSRHLRNKHSDENEVAEILIMEVSGKDKDIQKDQAGTSPYAWRPQT